MSIKHVAGCICQNMRLRITCNRKATSTSHVDSNVVKVLINMSLQLLVRPWEDVSHCCQQCESTPQRHPTREARHTTRDARIPAGAHCSGCGTQLLPDGIQALVLLHGAAFSGGPTAAAGAAGVAQGGESDDDVAAAAGAAAADDGGNMAAAVAAGAAAAVDGGHIGTAGAAAASAVAAGAALAAAAMPRYVRLYGYFLKGQ